MHPVQINGLEGLFLYYDFITPQEESALIEEIDKRPWGGLGIEPNPEMRRRTQHYGYEFSYRYRKAMTHLNDIPLFMQYLLEKMCETGMSEEIPNSCIVNEYNVGQGIMPHTDAPSIFGKAIWALSLLSPSLILFKRCVEVDGEVHKVFLPRRSLLVMTGSSRFDYVHSISKEIEETISIDKVAMDRESIEKLEYVKIRYEDQMIVITRDRRVSLTFRKVIQGELN